MSLSRSLIVISLFSTAVLSVPLFAANSVTTSTAVLCAEISITRQQLKADGVELTERYRERLYRSTSVIAFERIRPAGFSAATAEHESHERQERKEHSGNPHHSHPDGMVRRYEKLADGSIAYSLFDDLSQQEIRLLPTEFADFGFDGDFQALYTLADAATLKTLGTKDQHIREPQRELRWSGREQIVRFQHQRWPGGEQTVTVTPTDQCSDPRSQRANFAVIDYADTLD